MKHHKQKLSTKGQHWAHFSQHYFPNGQGKLTYLILFRVVEDYGSGSTNRHR